MANPEDLWDRVHAMDHQERFDADDVRALAICCVQLRDTMEELQQIIARHTNEIHRVTQQVLQVKSRQTFG